MMFRTLYTFLKPRCKCQIPTKAGILCAHNNRDSLNEEVEREAKLFTEALKSYESDVPEKHKTGIDIGQPCSIKELVELIDSSLAEYRKDGHRTVWQVIRKGFWKLSEGSEGLESWLELLPSSNDYCSLIYGGISLILKVLYDSLKFTRWYELMAC